MDRDSLQRSINEFKQELETAIQNAEFDTRKYENGQKAKEALIRSQRLILKLHEVVKTSVGNELSNSGTQYSVHPPVGASTPELKLSGFLKAKMQDVVFLTGGLTPSPERISDGPLTGELDSVGKSVTEKAIVVGVRSQMSSVAKNFDTLMERAFAETLNLRLRLPGLVMGEVYVLPVVEYDDKAMTQNRIVFKVGRTPIEKFIRTFVAISERALDAAPESAIYKYDHSALVLADFRPTIPKIYYSLEELISDNLISASCRLQFNLLEPSSFARKIVESHRRLHQ